MIPIDMTRLVTAETKAAARLADARATASLTRIEMAGALMLGGLLTPAEAEEFAARGLPAPIADLIETLPEDRRQIARLKMIGATDFPRSDALWDDLCAAPGWPEHADVDALFGIAAA
ncbi:hypothetical protein ORIO_12600 [Cereibacter azotoformans]|uniref:hypothetical protein n=1 Tax=Cereibacter azotoformans TaxID=43057 RepID=UPI001EEBD63E|nr:hypothetical protein [Cereibacter azotoformans]ULB10743.1 hypothetical protein ORIO_12600 [Cereibacter azotoformans]